MSRIRYGVIGVGHLGKEHARIAATLTNVELVGVVDPNPEQARAIAEKNKTTAYSQPHELLGKVDAVSIVAPTTLHAQIAEPFLKRGVPLLIEKPLAGNLNDANRLVDIAAAHRTTVQVGHIERFNPAYEELLSRPMHPRFIRCQRVGPFTGRSFDVGVVFDLMIHDLDLILDFVKSDVVDVQATGISVFGGHEDVASARLHFANGCVAEVLASRASATPARTMQVWAAEGFADVDFGQRRVTLVQPTEDVRRNGLDPNRLDPESRAKIREELFTKYLPTMTIDGQAKDQLTAELSHFVHCVRTGEVPRVTAAAARDAIAVAERIVAATKTQRADPPGEVLGGPHRFPSVGNVGEDRRAA